MNGGDFRNGVARGPGKGRHDGPVALQQRIEKRALADIGATDDSEREAVVNQLAVAETFGEPVQNNDN